MSKFVKGVLVQAKYFLPLAIALKRQIARTFLPRSFGIRFHYIIQSIGLSTPPILHGRRFAKPRGRYQQLGPKSKIPIVRLIIHPQHLTNPTAYQLLTITICICSFTELCLCGFLRFSVTCFCHYKSQSLPIERKQK